MTAGARAGDPLRDLAQSTDEFYKRFGVQPQLENCINNFQEEVRELIEAARDGGDPAHTAEECADVFVTAIGILYASGIDLERMIEQVYTVVRKNDAKTHETHVYRDGKIRRRAT
jgi:NTP pyrophosphatase (non-canonical NTP hydrolase)